MIATIDNLTSVFLFVTNCLILMRYLLSLEFFVLYGLRHRKFDETSSKLTLFWKLEKIFFFFQKQQFLIKIPIFDGFLKKKNQIDCIKKKILFWIETDTINNVDSTWWFNNSLDFIF